LRTKRFFCHGTVRTMRWPRAPRKAAAALRATGRPAMVDSRERLESFLSGRWQSGEGIETRLVDPVSGDELASVSAKGLDLRSALDFARTRGQAAVRGLGYVQR